MNMSGKYLYRASPSSNLEYLFIAVVFVAIGTWCYQLFFQADFLVYSYLDTQDWTTVYGYTYNQYVALLIGTILLPLGLTALLIFAVQGFKQPWNVYGKSVAFGASFCALVVCTYYSYVVAEEVLSCGVFCFGEAETFTSEVKGAWISMGMLSFFVCLILDVLFGALTVMCVADVLTVIESSPDEHVRLMGNSDEQNNGRPTSPKLHPDPYTVTSEHINKFWMLFLVFAILFPLVAFATISLPTSWAAFSQYAIRAYQATDPPSYAGSVFLIRVSDYTLLKVYPDIISFYAGIYLVALVALAAQAIPALQKFLNKRPWIIPFQASIGEALLFLIFVAMMVTQFVYFYLDHGWESSMISSRTKAERAARSMGQVANLLVGLLVLPVARNSIWTIVFGVSHESMLVYHTWMGGLLLFVILAHMLLWWKVYAQQHSFPQDIYSIPTVYHEDDFTIPLSFQVFILAILFMFIPAISYVRRYSYEAFYFLHHFALVFFLFMLWHATMSWYYLVGGLTLYAVDHVIRMAKSVGYQVEVQNIAVVADDTVIELSYTVATSYERASKKLTTSWFDSLWGASSSKPSNKALQHKVGQYCFVNIPSISALEWHPFTISSIPDVDATTTHYIKALDPVEWTGQLKYLAANYEGSTHMSSLLVNIDGPYGTPVKYQMYEHLVLVAGGIGITPLQATFRYLMHDSVKASHLKTLKLVWVTRSAAEADIFKQKIEQAMQASSMGQDPLVCSCEIYITRASDASSSLSADNSEKANTNKNHVTVFSGHRPSAAHVLKPYEDAGSACMAFTCGPAALVEDYSLETQRLGLEFKTETFAF